MEIKKILKPKSADDINTSICQLYDISIDNKKDIETINKLYSIIDIKNCDTSAVKIYYLAMIYSSDNEQQNQNAATPLSDLFNAAISLSRIEIRLQSYDFKIKKKINSWSKIYREFVNMMLNEGVIINKEINDKRNLFLHINMCSNMIAQSSKKGPANFIITSNKIKKIIEEFRPNYNIIIDNKLKDNILIGRKDTRELDSNIRLLKHKNCYKIVTCEPSEIKNCYICLNCELKF